MGEDAPLRRGTGIGLALARENRRAARGGRIRAREATRGARFTGRKLVKDKEHFPRRGPRPAQPPGGTCSAATRRGRISRTDGLRRADAGAREEFRLLDIHEATRAPRAGPRPRGGLAAAHLAWLVEDTPRRHPPGGHGPAAGTSRCSPPRTARRAWRMGAERSCPSLIVTDLMMRRGMDGLELTRAGCARTRPPGTSPNRWMLTAAAASWRTRGGRHGHRG